MTSSRMSYVNSPMDYKIPYFTIPGRLEELSDKLRNKEVYVFVSPGGKRVPITASKLFDSSINIAKKLVKLGLKKGDVVACSIPNTIDSLVCSLGIISAGCIVLNVSIPETNVEHLTDKLSKTVTKCMIVDPGPNNSDVNTCIKFIEKNWGDGNVSSTRIPSLKFLLTTTSIDRMKVVNIMNNTIDVSGIILPRVDPEDQAVMFTTSGSTGLPKFVPQSHHAAFIVGKQLNESMLFETDDVIYTERRLAWIGGFPYMYLHNGVKTVTKTTPFATLNEHCLFTAKVMENEKCNIACLFPATITGLVDLWKETKTPKVMLKNIHSGAMPVAAVCMSAIGRFTEAVTNCYGSSEGGFLAANIVNQKSEFQSYCCGIPIAGVEIKVVGESGMILPRGETGMIHVRSPSLFWNYFNDPDKTKEVLSTSHWMDTDDVGYISNDGKLTVSGRKSDIILQSGKIFVPSKVEAFIKSHPDVLDVIVVSIPDVAKFALVCACVIGKPGRDLAEETIRQHLATEYRFSDGEAFVLSAPEHVLIYDDYPRLYTGKPDKKRLRETAIARLEKRH